MATIAELEARATTAIQNANSLNGVANNTSLSQAERDAAARTRDSWLRTYESTSRELVALRQEEAADGGFTQPAEEQGFVETVTTPTSTVDDPTVQEPRDPAADLRAFREADAASLIAPVEERVLSQVAKNPNDWRCRIRLANSADYLYRAPDTDVGILKPLQVTDGVIFPYTPSISTVYHADYAQQQLPHSNWQGYFYKGSSPGEIALTATFTAQDAYEASYLLAVIHFFRSASKMFYGQDYQRGAPPPVLFLSAFGEHQYNNAPCVLRDFTYTLPADVDYIRTTAGSVPQGSIGAPKNPLRYTGPLDATLARLSRLGVKRGGDQAPAPVSERSIEPVMRTSTSTMTQSEQAAAFAAADRESMALFNQMTTPPPGSPTADSASSARVDSLSYVPTKLEVSLVLLPLQNREQMSKEFSLRDYASGRLVTRGFY